MTDEPAVTPNPVRQYYEVVIQNLELLRVIGLLYPRIAFVGVARELEVAYGDISPWEVMYAAQDLEMGGRGYTPHPVTEIARKLVRSAVVSPQLANPTRTALANLFDQEGECAHNRKAVPFETLSQVVDAAIELVKHFREARSGEYWCRRMHLGRVRFSTVLNAPTGTTIEIPCAKCDDVRSYTIPDGVEGPANSIGGRLLASAREWLERDKSSALADAQ